MEGLDLWDTTPPAEIEALRRALDQHQLLLFRCSRQLPPERQVEIARWFGPVLDNTGDGQCWTVLHNDEASGRIVLPFHSDLSYTDSPIEVISTQATALPPAGSSTHYVSGVEAWSTLPRELQERLAGLTLRHRYVSETLQDLPVMLADHALCLRHPRTGKPVLYATEYHAHRIHELEREESDRLIEELLAHLYAPGHVYAHAWQLYDFLIWDNLAVQHARPAEASPAAGARALQRVQVSDVRFMDVVRRAREEEPLPEIPGRIH